MSTRRRVQALGQGQGDGRGIAVPLALAPAARIQERDWEDFTEDPTQLSNGLRDLLQAVRPDGLVVTDPNLLLEQGSGGLLRGSHAQAALEATRRLRVSVADTAALVVCLPGPSAVGAGDLLETGKAFLGAGADALIIFDDDSAAVTSLSTLVNVARFHQGVVVATAQGTSMPSAARSPVSHPAPANGLAITDVWLPRNTDLALLEEWVDAVRG